MSGRRLGDAIDEDLRRLEGGKIDNEGVEVLVVMLFFEIVMRGPAGQVGLGFRAQAEQHVDRHLAVLRLHDLHHARQGLADLGGHLPALDVGHQVGLVQDYQIGAEQLVLEHLFQGIVVVERLILRPLPRQRRGIIGKAASRDRGAIDHGDDTIDRDA